MEWSPESQAQRAAVPPGPSWRDWGLLGLNLAFVVMGLFILPRKFDVGVVTIVFFGFCAFVPITTILRKQRDRRLRPLRAAVVGGVRIRPSRMRVGALGAGVLALGATLVVFGRGYPLLFQAMAWLVLGTGVFVSTGVALGKLPVGHLMFTPNGLTIGRRRFAVTVSWDDIAAWDGAEFNDNPILRIWLHLGATPLVEPATLTAQAVRDMTTNEGWMGAPITVLTGSYALDLPILMKAIERYVREPESRAELDSSRLLAAP